MDAGPSWQATSTRQRASRWVGSSLVALGFVLAFLCFGGRNLAAVVAGAAALAALAGCCLFLGTSAGLRPRVASLAVGVLLLWGALGLVPLPAGLLSSLSPRRAAIEAALPGNLEQWPERLSVESVSLSTLRAEGSVSPSASDEEGKALSAAVLSFDPDRTRTALLVLTAWLLLLVALCSLQRESQGLCLLGFLTCVVAAGSVFGLWQARQAGKSIYGIELPAFSYHTPYATFWNSNHYSSLCAMLLPLLLATALSRERALWMRLGALLLGLPIGLAVLDAGSRGGLLAAGLGATMLGLCLCASPGRRKLGAALVLSAVLAVGATFTVFAERLIDESLEQTLSSASNAFRLALYEQELRMIREAPILGHGLGAFTPAHAAYNESLEATVPFHGEGDWLESAVEGGLPMVLAWLVLVASLIAPALRAVAAGRAPPQLSALVAGLTAVLAHAAVDFHLRETAVAAATIVMLATAHVWGRRLRVGETETEGTGGRSGWILGAACFLLTLVLVQGVPQARDYDRAKDAALQAKLSALKSTGEDAGAFLAEALAQAERVVAARPSSGDSWSLLASAEVDQVRWFGRSRKFRERRKEHRLKALEASVQALRLSPSSLGVAHRAGSILLSVGAEDEAQAAASLALLVAPMSPEANSLQGRVFLRLGKDDEALAPLALAYRATPLSKLSAQARSHARALLIATGDEPARFLQAVPEERHRAAFLLALARVGLAEELPPFFALLCEEDALDFPKLQAGLLRHAPGLEAARLAVHLLPQAEGVELQVVLAEAMLQGGEGSGGEALLRNCLAVAECPPRAALLLVDTLRESGRQDELCRVLASAGARWPADEQLARRSVLCMDSP